MNPSTRVVIFCYEGDRHQVELLLPYFQHHQCPITIMSPVDSKVRIKGFECIHAGRRAYIGEASISRHREHLRLLLVYPEKHFFLCDPDSFCLSPEFPARLYRDANETVWSNECVETRPHETPYDKIAMQPPYFLTKDTIKRLLAAHVPLHPITQYIDWWWVAHCWRAGIVHRPFTLMEHASTYMPGAVIDDPWQQLDYRIRCMGAVMMHPIKTPEQIAGCVAAYASRIS